MIKINLLPKTKKFQMPVILGLDLGKLNIKVLLLFIVFHYIATGYLTDFFAEKRSALEAEVNELSKERTKLRNENRKYKDIQEQIKELLAQERNLQERKRVVESIILTKKNPRKLLLYISNNIPKDIWIDKLVVKGDRLSVEGFALSFKSIRIFMDNLQKSVFFDRRFEIGKSETVTDEETGARKEKFSISGYVARYE